MITPKVLYWLPRFLGILAILFVSLFAFDTFQQDLTFWQQLSDFMIHLIPSFVLLVILFIAWKWELIGGVMFIIIGLGFSSLIFNHNYAMNHSIMKSVSIIAMITFPFVLTGILFISNYFYKKKE